MIKKTHADDNCTKNLLHNICQSLNLTRKIYAAAELSSWESPPMVTYYRLLNGPILLCIYKIKNDHDILDTRMIVVNHFK